MPLEKSFIISYLFKGNHHILQLRLKSQARASNMRNLGITALTKCAAFDELRVINFHPRKP